MNLKMIALALVVAASTTFAAADTSLVLKPSPEQVKAAKVVGNKMCPVSDEAIGGMGPGKTVIYQGKAVQLCCGSCVKKFAKDPAKYLAAAESSAKPTEKKEGHDMKDMKGM
jgi:hypothetical protein